MINKNIFKANKRNSLVISNIINYCGANNRLSYNFLPIKGNFIASKFLKDISSKSQTKLQNKRNIDFIIKLKNYKGLRHRKHLPVRGQRTRTNAKTIRRKLK